MTSWTGRGFNPLMCTFLYFLPFLSEKRNTCEKELVRARSKPLLPRLNPSWKKHPMEDHFSCSLSGGECDRVSPRSGEWLIFYLMADRSNSLTKSKTKRPTNSTSSSSITRWFYTQIKCSKNNSPQEQTKQINLFFWEYETNGDKKVKSFCCSGKPQRARLKRWGDTGSPWLLSFCQDSHACM